MKISGYAMFSFRDSGNQLFVDRHSEKHKNKKSVVNWKDEKNVIDGDQVTEIECHFWSQMVIKCHGHFWEILGNEILVIMRSALSNPGLKGYFEIYMWDYGKTVHILYSTCN